MDNKGFEITLNNELICRAGLKDNHGVVNCIVGAVIRKDTKEQELYINVSGLNSDTMEHVKWLKLEVLNEHDKITIEIIKDSFDPPNEVDKKKSDAYLLEQKIKTYKKLKEELKDYI
jgi:hypothetical protein